MALLPLAKSVEGKAPFWLYPDVRLVGLTTLLGWLTREMPARAVVTGGDGPPHASIQLAERTARVTLAAEQRLFLTVFCAHGVTSASASYATLAAAASAMRCWAQERCSEVELPSRTAPLAFAAEDVVISVAQEVEHRWQTLLALPPLPTMVPDHARAIALAASRPELRMLYPFQSMYALCFSRCTRYPYTRDCPFVLTNGGDQGAVYYPDQTSTAPMDLATALTLVVRGLPPGCGPAVRGTADDVPPTTGAGEGS